MSAPPSFAEIAAALDLRTLPLSIVSDSHLHELELERLFVRAWMFVGHESEVPRPGDYATRSIGQDQFVFARGEDGVVRVFFNACRHRGAQICRAERGNTTHFRCPYHGWTYKNSGELVGAPASRAAYPDLDRSAWGLVEAAYVDSVCGLVFACLDPDAPSLDEYLGDMRWYLEMLFGLSGDGIEVVGGPQRWVIPANWKSAAENFAGDDYHIMYLHKSIEKLGGDAPDYRKVLRGVHVQAGNGHAISLSTDLGRDTGRSLFWGFPNEITERFGTGVADGDQVELARRCRLAVGNVFPNLSFLISPLTPDPNRIPFTPVMTIRVWQPLGPAELEAWVWFVSWRGAPPEFARRSHLAGIGTFSAGGIFEQDDSEPWQAIARNSRGAYARATGVKLNYAMGAAEISPIPMSEWAGPGVAYATRLEDGAQRSFYRRWLQFLGDEGYPAHQPAGSQ
jgi:nitrite reductase/ring-hydroxylating ferredoxin subunit